MNFLLTIIYRYYIYNNDNAGTHNHPLPPSTVATTNSPWKEPKQCFIVVWALAIFFLLSCFIEFN